MFVADCDREGKETLSMRLQEREYKRQSLKAIFVTGACQSALTLYRSLFRTVRKPHLDDIFLQSS